ncbi:hypothetical protein [Phytoactinopolyspora limicola]|uniref:hypothetical protein n=1 Tax=Phytoactinopolyspora limicola TaxID=2715536 RepID=UPI003CCD2CF1
MLAPQVTDGVGELVDGLAELDDGQGQDCDECDEGHGRDQAGDLAYGHGSAALSVRDDSLRVQGPTLPRRMRSAPWGVDYPRPGDRRLTTSRTWCNIRNL